MLAAVPVAAVVAVLPVPAAVAVAARTADFSQVVPAVLAVQPGATVVVWAVLALPAAQGVMPVRAVAQWKSLPAVRSIYSALISLPKVGMGPMAQVQAQIRVMG